MTAAPGGPGVRSGPGHAALHAAEAAYWRHRAEAAERAIAAVADAAVKARQCFVSAELPPEPPVGTTLVDAHDDDRVVWTRGEDGWHCGRQRRGDCFNCPCDWFEVVEQGGLGYERMLP